MDVTGMLLADELADDVFFGVIWGWTVAQCKNNSGMTGKHRKASSSLLRGSIVIWLVSCEYTCSDEDDFGCDVAKTVIGWVIRSMSP